MIARRMFIALTAFLVGCQLGGQEEGYELKVEGVPPASLSELAEWMTGSFSSAAQSEALPADFFDIRLFTVPIWAERSDGPWLYVEQAAADSLDKPYRQRVYHLVESGGGVSSEVYELPGAPSVYAGKWRDPASFDVLRPSLLIEREGCAVHLRRTDLSYVGSTRGEGCMSAMRGAVYASSVVTVSERRITSWDRGFDAEGGQVWGARLGPYEFAKQ